MIKIIFLGLFNSDPELSRSSKNPAQAPALLPTSLPAYGETFNSINSIIFTYTNLVHFWILYLTTMLRSETVNNINVLKIMYDTEILCMKAI